MAGFDNQVAGGRLTKKLLIAVVLLLLVGFTSCSESGPKIQDGGVSMKNDTRVSLSIGVEKIIVRMHDNPTSRDFLSMLPLKLKFSDYAGTEKISYLPRNLSTESAPNGFDPSKGDFTLYAPWGNLAVFYKDFSYSPGLISLGVIESGIEKMEEMKGDFEVLIEKRD